MLPTDAKARKAVPIYSGFIKYFPKAIAAVAELSRIGNEQHNPGAPLHWDRSKSGDELDAMLRHILDMAGDAEGARDTDGVYHATKAAWRAMANLEKLLEFAEPMPAAPESDSGDWIPWYGETNRPPVAPGLRVLVRFRDSGVAVDKAGVWTWKHGYNGDPSDIVAWRRA